MRVSGQDAFFAVPHRVAIHNEEKTKASPVSGPNKNASVCLARMVRDKIRRIRPRLNRSTPKVGPEDEGKPQADDWRPSPWAEDSLNSDGQC